MQKPIMWRQALFHYQVDADGYPVMSTLELLRYRRFLNIKVAARALGMTPKTLRVYKCGGVHLPKPKPRAALERVFEMTWEKLRAPAPHLRLAKAS